MCARKKRKRTQPCEERTANQVAAHEASVPTHKQAANHALKLNAVLPGLGKDKQERQLSDLVQQAVQGVVRKPGNPFKKAKPSPIPETITEPSNGRSSSNGKLLQQDIGATPHPRKRKRIDGKPASPYCQPTLPSGKPVTAGSEPMPAAGKAGVPSGEPLLQNGEAKLAGGKSRQPGGKPKHVRGKSAQPGLKPTQLGGNPTQMHSGTKSPGGKASTPSAKPTRAGEDGTQLGGRNTPAGAKHAKACGKAPHPGGKYTQRGGKPTQLGAKPTPLGGKPANAGGQPMPQGGKPTQQDGKPTQPRGKPTPPGGKPTPPGEKPTLPNGKPTPLGGKPTQLGGKPAQLGGKPAKAGGQPTPALNAKSSVSTLPSQAGSNWARLQTQIRSTASGKGRGAGRPPRPGPPTRSLGQERGATPVLALDCEMVGVGPDGKRSMLARVCMVNAEGNVLLDTFVAPVEKVTDYRTKVSGVRPHDLKGAPSFKEVQEKVSELLQGRVLVGHSVDKDLTVLMLGHPRSHIRDTARYPPLLRYLPATGKHRSQRLRDIARSELGLVIQEGEHSPVDDARAALYIYLRRKKEWEAAVRDGSLYKRMRAISAKDFARRPTGGRKRERASGTRPGPPLGKAGRKMVDFLHRDVRDDPLADL